LLLFLSGCIPFVNPPSPTYSDKIQVELQNEITGDFYIQHLSNGKWQNVLILRSASVGTHIDTIPYLSGLYRIVTTSDSSNISIIK
jgi:hypothetical protein